MKWEVEVKWSEVNVCGRVKTDKRCFENVKTEKYKTHVSFITNKFGFVFITEFFGFAINKFF